MQVLGVFSVLNTSRVLFCAQCKDYVTVTLLGCGKSKRGSCGCREMSAFVISACSELIQKIQHNFYVKLHPFQSWKCVKHSM